MSEITKQEGEFKIKKTTPKKLVTESKVTKVDFTTPVVEPEVVKVTIPNENLEANAVQEQNTDESVLRTEQSEVELQAVVEGNQGSFENAIQEITNEEVKTLEVEKHVEEHVNTGKPLPENCGRLC